MDAHDPAPRQRREDGASHEGLVAQVRDANAQLVLASMDARRRAAELEAALSSIADGVVVYGPDAEIIRLNRTAEELLSLSPDARELPHDARVRRLRAETEEGRPLDPDQAPVRKALRGETVRGFVMVLHRPEGRATWVSASAAPIRMADGEVIGAVATFTDITELHELQEQRERVLAIEQRAREEAERAVKLRDEFLSVAAHELKTPITSLKGFSQVIVRKFLRNGGVEQADLVKALTAIDQQTKKLTRLTEQLLDASRLDAGKLPLAREEVEVSAVVEGAIASVQQVYPRRAILLRGVGPIRAVLDPLRMEQVLVNLLDNAAKFSSEDAPIEVETAPGPAGELAISVRDHGKGIPEEECGRIFERFHQIHEYRHYGGMGLGLYISSEIVRMHGGSITCEPPDGPGARFVIRLPLRPST